MNQPDPRRSQAGFTVSELAIASTISLMLFSGMIALTSLSQRGHETVVDVAAANGDLRGTTDGVSEDLRTAARNRVAVQPLENGTDMLTFQIAIGTNSGTAVYGCQTREMGVVVDSDEIMALAPASAVENVDAGANTGVLRTVLLSAKKLLDTATSTVERTTAESTLDAALYKEDWYTRYLAVPDPSDDGKSAVLIRQLLNDSQDIMRSERIARGLLLNGGFQVARSGESIVVAVHRRNRDGSVSSRKFSIVPMN